MARAFVCSAWNRGVPDMRDHTNPSTRSTGIHPRPDGSSEFFNYVSQVRDHCQCLLELNESTQAEKVTACSNDMIAANLAAIAGRFSFINIGKLTGYHPETVRRYLRGESRIPAEFVSRFCISMRVPLAQVLLQRTPRVQIEPKANSAPTSPESSTDCRQPNLPENGQPSGERPLRLKASRLTQERTGTGPGDHDMELR